MSYFEQWHQDIRKNYSSCMNLLNGDTKKEIILLGDPNSGKTVFIEEVLKNCWLDKELHKKIDSIIKVSFENYPKIERLYINDKNIVKEILQNGQIDVNMSVGFISLTLPLKSLLKKKLTNKKQIIWFENVTLTNDLSIDYVHNFLNQLDDIPDICIFSTAETKIRKISSQLATKHFKIPALTFREYKKIKKQKPKDTPAKNSIITRLIALNDDEKVKQLIELGGESYGNIELLYNVLIGNEIANDKLSKDDVLKMLCEINRTNEVEIKKLLLALLATTNCLSMDWLEQIFQHSQYDFITDLEKLEERNIVYYENGRYTFSPVLSKFCQNSTTLFDDKRAKYIISKTIDQLLKEEFPEEYHLRALNARSFNLEKEQEYEVIFCLRNHSRYDTVSANEKTALLYSNLTNLLALDVKEMTKEQFQELEHISLKKLPLLVSAELEYHKLQYLLSLSYQERLTKRHKIELLLHKMIPLYNDLVLQKEMEMAIKLGLLLAPELVNFLPNDETTTAVEIFNYVQKQIHHFLKENYFHYKFYDVIAKLRSTSILNYRVASRYLWSILDEYEHHPDSSILNYNEIIPPAFSNLLGISMYISQQELVEVLEFYSNNKQIIDGFSNSKHKLTNNLSLAHFLQQDQVAPTTEILDAFTKIKKQHVCMINYAGLLFYQKNYSGALEILNTLQELEKEEDFYFFYCQYNKIMIEMCQENFDPAILSHQIDNLVIPALLTDNSLITKLKNRLISIKKLINSSKKFTADSLDQELSVYTIETAPILKRAWLFSDYQYWS